MCFSEGPGRRGGLPELGFQEVGELGRGGGGGSRQASSVEAGQSRGGQRSQRRQPNWSGWGTPLRRFTGLTIRQL